MTARKALYVGGITQEVTQAILEAAFIPFGELRDVHIPMDYRDNTNKGFAFVEFVDEYDADAAIENMDGAELFGKPLRVNATKGIKKGDKAKSVWSSEEYLQEAQSHFDQDQKNGGDAPEAPEALNPTH